MNIIDYEGGNKTIFDKYELNEEAKAMISIIQTKMKYAKLTDEGKECKEKIIKFYEKSTLLLNSNLFMLVLSLFKSFILTFAQKEPLIHQTHRSLAEDFYTFFGCFMKFEVINTRYKLNLMDVASNV